MKLTTLILTALTWISLAQAQQFKLGWKSDPNHSRKLRQFVHAPGMKAVVLPDAVDLSGVMPGGPAAPLAGHAVKAYDQEDEGSCTANAGCAAFEFLWHKMTGSFVPASRQGLYICELMHDGNWPHDYGSYTSTIVWVLRAQGVGQEKLLPYSSLLSTKPSAAYYADAAKRPVIDAFDVDSTDGISIRKALASGLPVIFGGYVFPSIQKMNRFSYFNPPHSGRPLGGHERLIMGYDRKLQRVVNGKTITGWYWVLNSWGTGWGLKGYCWEPMTEIENPRLNEDFAVLVEIKKN